MSDAKLAVEVLVEGFVQGVGYRDFVQRRARHFGLIGDVMNLPDGRVRVRAEGRHEVLEEFVKELEKGPPLARVRRLSLNWFPATSRFDSFRIRFAGFEP